MELTKDRLVNLRKERNINQDVIAELLGVSRSTISNYENGLPIPIEALTALAKYYDVSIEYLLCLSSERRPAAGALSKKFQQYAEASKGKGFTASEVATVLDALTRYYQKGAPAGDLPPKILCGFLDGFAAALNAAATHDVTALLDSVNAATIAAMDMNKLITTYFELERSSHDTSEEM